MVTSGYEAAWKREEDLEGLNLRLHDGVPIVQLEDRARGYLDKLFGTYPGASPAAGARVVEFGSGVGWIIEAMLKRYPQIGEIVGLDISESIVRRAHERFGNPKARFVIYDGRRFPFEEGTVDVIYSCATIQHIEKHVAFLLLMEMFRVLAPGGHAVLHFMSVGHIPRSSMPYEVECLNHIDNVPEHWHHYYTFDELFVLLAEVIGVDELDIRPQDGFDSFVVHFSKDTGNPYLRPELPSETYAARQGGTLPSDRGESGDSGDSSDSSDSSDGQDGQDSLRSRVAAGPLGSPLRAAMRLGRGALRRR